MTRDAAGAGADGVSHTGERSAFSQGHEETHSRLLEDIGSRSNTRSEPIEVRPEYKNGLASEKLMDIEKWVDESKRCSLSIDQDQLASKLSKFAKETGELWKGMEEHMKDKPQDFLRMSQDQFMTYGRFTDLLFSLDDEHRDAVREQLPGYLVPGE